MKKVIATISVSVVSLLVAFLAGRFTAPKPTVTIRDVVRVETNEVIIRVGTNAIIDTRPLSPSSLPATDGDKWRIFTNNALPKTFDVIASNNELSYVYSLYDPVTIEPVHTFTFTNEREATVTFTNAASIWGYVGVGTGALVIGIIGGIILSR